MRVQLDAIARVSGVDVLFVGPFDLGNNIGHPILDGTMHQELKDAITRILQVAKENKKSTGIYATSGEQAREFADQGFHMVSFILTFSENTPHRSSSDLRCSGYGCAPHSNDLGTLCSQRIVCALGAESGQRGSFEDDQSIADSTGS